MNSPSFIAAKVNVLFLSKHLYVALIRCRNTLRWLTTSCNYYYYYYYYYYL
jgi:hypothetical protein